jgi:ribosomal subunit interface protein
METIITARHCEISDTLRDRASTIVERLEALAPREVQATIVFDMEGAAATAEVRVHVANGDMLVASGDGPDHRTALDRAEERMRRQVTRASGRYKTARHLPADASQG